MRTLTASDAAKAVVRRKSVPAPINAVAPTEPPAVAVRNVFELAAAMEFGSGIDDPVVRSKYHE